MIPSRLRLPAPLACFLLAVAARALVASRVALPGRDGATYLWMGEQVTSGNFAASFQTVFPPVYPWTIAAVLAVAPDLDVVVAGQAASGGLAALAVFPLFMLTQRLIHREAATFTCLFYALGTWFCRHPADCMSEGPFYLWVACAALLLVRKAATWSTVTTGILIALAYGTRPEGAALAIVSVPWMWMQDRRHGLLLAASTLVASLAFPLGYMAFGPGFTVTPKAAFMWPHGAGGGNGGSDGIWFYLEHVLRLPGHAFEALGYLATIFAVVGITRRRDRSLRSGESLLLLLFLLQVLVIPLARSTIRFVSGYGMLMLVFAGAGFVRVRCWPRLSSRPAFAALLLLAFAPDLVRLPQAQREDKQIERDLGEFLRARMQPSDIVVSAEHRASSSYDLPFSMCRVEFFVGMEPSPPRPLAIAELRAMAQDPRCKFGLIAQEPAGFGQEDLVALGFEPMALPDDLAHRAAKRRIAAFERRR